MSKVRLGVGILAVPQRKQRISVLLERLGVSDKVVSWDVEHKGHIPNWWKAADIACAHNTTHALIIEDDAEPSRDLLAAVKNLVALYPDRVINLYTYHPFIKGVAPGSLVRMPEAPNCDVAVVYPSPWLRELKSDFLANQDLLAKKTHRWGLNADEMRVILRPGHSWWATAPSLVQHGCPTESMLGHNWATNVSSWCLSTDESALSIDWAVAKV